MRPYLLSILVGSSLLAQAPASKGAAAKAPAARPSLMNPKSLNAKAPELYKAEFTTTKGVFVVEVHRDWAPIGADRFYNLVKNGFYTNAAFFRVIPDFVAQFGMSAIPAIGHAWDNANLLDDRVAQSNKRGNLCFATRGPNTRTTQLFINLKDNAGLDAQGFASFGKVVEGMETVVDKLYSGYGDNGPQQGQILAQGKAYLDKDFPKLDSIKTARILPAEGAPADKK